MEQLQPVPVVRCEDGYFMHPALGHFWDVEMNQDEHCTKEQWSAWAARNGIETETAHLENEDMGHPAYIAYFDNEGNASEWHPEAPGPDWFVLQIGDSEDGPFAVFARHVPAPK